MLGKARFLGTGKMGLKKAHRRVRKLAGNLFFLLRLFFFPAELNTKHDRKLTFSFSIVYFSPDWRSIIDKYCPVHRTREVHGLLCSPVPLTITHG